MGHPDTGMGIPYASAVGPDQKESVVDLAVQTLIVFLDYVIPGRGSPAPASARGVSTEQVLDSVRYGMLKWRTRSDKSGRDLATPDEIALG